MFRRARLLAAIALTISAAEARAQTSYPMVTRVQPAAVQVGRGTEITVSGTQNFTGASRMLFEGTGLSAEVLPGEAKAAPPSGMKGRGATGSVRARLSVAPDASLGPRELRVVTPQGASSVGMIVVVTEPVAPEADDKANDDPEGAQPLVLPVAVAGSVGKVEDVDWYTFHAEAGQQITFSLWGNRLQDKIHDLQAHLDPILLLYDDQGRELATGDNYYFADPMLSYTFREAGTYSIQVRDTTYAGNPNWSYVLQATAGPYATSAFPMAVRPGAEAEIRASGPNLDEGRVITLKVPDDIRPGPVALPLPTAHGLTPPVPLVATELPLAVEAEDAPAPPDQPRPLALPVALSGRLGRPNDVDAFRIEAQKGQSFSFEVMARRVGSAADPVLRLADAKGKTLVEVDVTFGKDPRLDWTAPADGAYALQVFDLHNRGGGGFGYVLLARESQPEFTVSCDPDKVNIGPGARAAVFVKVERRNGFRGPVTLDWEGLPAGVSASPLTVPPQMTQGVIVVSAAPDAPKGGALVTLVGKSETPAGPISRPATPRQEIYMPGGGRGLFDVSTMAVAVTDPSDITVEAGPSEILLAPGQVATIDVTVTRRAGFDKPVNLAVELAHLGRAFATPLPPGVTVNASRSKTLLAPDSTSGTIVLEAKPDAPPSDKVPIAVLGHVSINFVVKTAYSSAPIMVTVPAKAGPATSGPP